MQLPLFGEADWERSLHGGFVAGSIFWARRDVLEVPMAKAGVRNLYNLLSTAAYKTHGDGGVEHAFERVFGALVMASGSKIAFLRTGIASERCELCRDHAKLAAVPACSQCAGEDSSDSFVAFVCGRSIEPEAALPGTSPHNRNWLQQINP